MIYRSRRENIKKFIQKKIRKYKIFNKIKLTKELNLLIFFGFLFFIIVSRLFYLQIVKANHYETLLNNQHINKSLLKANRWQIFVYDNSSQAIQLTENIKTYNIYAEPPYIWDKQRFIDLISPLIYEHLCVVNWMKEVDKENCIKNIENFTNKDLLPQKPQFFYYGSGIISEWANSFDRTWFNERKQQLINNFSSWTAYDLIKRRLDDRIYIWVNPKNYLGFFENKPFLEEISKLTFIEIEYENYAYIIPEKVKNFSKNIEQLKKILNKYGYLESFKKLDDKFLPQENKYVKVVSDVNPDIAQKIKDLKTKYYSEKTEWKIPVLHWLWLEENTKRYYTYWSFMSNIIGYVDKIENAYYWIEQYFNESLAWIDWEIEGRSSSMIWQVWANWFKIKNVLHWDDIYLTIDMWIQREIEMIAQKYQQNFKADSVSILVYDPFNWQVKGSANAPTFNPNDYNEAYEYIPLWPENRYLLDDETYLEVPIYIKTWWQTILAKPEERQNTGLQKFIKKNIYWSFVFVDKNVSMAYEPWSIFKAFTVAIGLDIDEIRFYDFYNDPWEIKIWPYTISNVEKKCIWDNSFLNALVYSCNVGMVRIAQKVWEESFYNYLVKLWFGKLSWIELANEDPWELRSVATVSKARFFNNTFGQGLTATPIQLATAYWALVNWWFFVKPTIIDWIYDRKIWEFRKNPTNIVWQVFKKETTEDMKNALVEVMDINEWYIKNSRIEWFSLWWKSWTAQISYKWKYQNWPWRTNGSFVGIVSRDDLKYVIIIQVRRPRTTERWIETAWKIFRSVAQFIVDYSDLSG